MSLSLSLTSVSSPVNLTQLVRDEIKHLTWFLAYTSYAQIAVIFIVTNFTNFVDSHSGFHLLDFITQHLFLWGNCPSPSYLLGSGVGLILGLGPLPMEDEQVAKLGQSNSLGSTRCHAGRQLELSHPMTGNFLLSSLPESGIQLILTVSQICSLILVKRIPQQIPKKDYIEKIGDPACLKMSSLYTHTCCSFG